MDEVFRSKAQRSGDPQQIIHRGRFNAPLDAANKHRGQVGLLGQLLLTQAQLFPSDPDRIAQEATVFWDDRHDPPRNRKGQNLAMSLTTSL